MNAQMEALFAESGILEQLKASRKSLEDAWHRLMIAPFQGRTRKAISRKAARRMRRRWHA